ncbi:MAG: hypothetical protein GTO24_14910 [candidate division Zixibacteria bacterium]|nr:hypothetical protein [candidate division Zixibacteria bacterium]
MLSGYSVGPQIQSGGGKVISSGKGDSARAVYSSVILKLQKKRKPQLSPVSLSELFPAGKVSGWSGLTYILNFSAEPQED